MPTKLMAQGRSTIVDLIKGIDSFAVGADHLDKVLASVESGTRGMTSMIAELDKIVARGHTEGVSQETLNLSKQWLAELRQDTFKIRDQGRLLRKMRETIRKNLRAVGANTFDPNVAWPQIRHEVKGVRNLIAVVVRQTKELDERVKALRSRMDSMIKTGKKKIKQIKSANRRKA